MKSKFGLLIILTLLSLAFQNCGDPRGLEAANQPSTSQKNFNVGPIESPLVKKTLILPINGSRSLYLDSVQLDSKTGAMEILFSDNSQQIRRLPHDVLASLQGIFENYDLCGPAEPGPDELICTLSYVQPDAELVNPVSGESIRIGNTNDPCLQDRVNFCDPVKADQLKALMAEVVSKYQSYAAD